MLLSVSKSMKSSIYLQVSGADPEIEERGGHTWELVRPCGARSTRSFFFLLCVYSLGTGLVRIRHSVVGKSGSMLPRGKFSNLDHMRVLLRPSETTTTTQRLWQLDCNSGDSSYGRFSEPLPSESAFVFEGLPQNCLLGAADLCLQDMKHRDMHCVRVATR